MDQFYEDCRNGNLPPYTFLEPAMFGVDQRLRNDQHPHAGAYYDIRRGEQFYKRVYEALRAGPQWNDTLFLLTWVSSLTVCDIMIIIMRRVRMNMVVSMIMLCRKSITALLIRLFPRLRTGSVSPDHVVNPDGKTHPTFNFTRLGIRVPAVLISPRVPKGLVLPKTDIFEHASVPSTLHALFNMPYLTRRDANALAFHGYANLSEPRTDCPETLPDPAWNMD